jgi:hypothetical protein
MTTPRMFAFFAAALIAVFFLRAVAYGVIAPLYAAARTSVSSHATAN